MDLTKALTFARTHHQGILMTLRSDGRPQSSNIAFGVGDDGIVRISVTDDRAKTRNLRRDPRASLHVNRADFTRTSCSKEMLLSHLSPRGPTTPPSKS